MTENSKIVWLPTEKLKPYEHNAKDHDETQVSNIAKSLEKYGWQNPILLDKDNVIIAGHGRLLAAKSLGMDKCPCIFAEDLTEEQAREYRILDNKLNESAWNSELEFELAELDFSEFELDFDLNFEVDAEPTEVYEDEVPEVDEDAEPICKLGDIWQLGNHRLICGNSTDANVVNKLTGGRWLI